MEQYPIRTLFLKEFVRLLIIHSQPKNIENKIKIQFEKPKITSKGITIETNIQKKEEPFQVSMANITTQQIPIPRPFQHKQIHTNPPLKKPIINQLKSTQIKTKPSPGISYAQQLHKEIRSLPISSLSVQNFNEGGLRLIGSLLIDPAVFSIECPGTGKPVLVNKSGVIQATAITLSAEEIDNIIKEVSDKTRIPIISGTFKAALENFIITAIISEFIGTRFLIQKIVPLNHLM